MRRVRGLGARRAGRLGAQAVARAATRRPLDLWSGSLGRRRAQALAVLVLALAGAGVALTLTPSTALDTFVSSSSSDYAATQATYRQFGSDPVVVLVRSAAGSVIRPQARATLTKLEDCLAGSCGGRMPRRSVAFMYGPTTFLREAVAAVDTAIRSLTRGAAGRVRAAENAARTLARQRGLSSAEVRSAVRAAGELALERELSAFGGIASTLDLRSAPTLANQAFLRRIVATRHFSYLFPTADTAVIQLRLRAGLSDAQQRRAIRAVRAVVALARFHRAGLSYTVSGEPVLLSDLGGEIGGQLALLLAVAVGVMALVLLLAFRRRLRLLPLVLALAAVAITFGLTAAFGGRLTLADVAVFPVLLGLAVDYGVQLRSGTPRGATAIAALGTAAGFLALLISPVPMVRGFGLLLVVGVAVALAVAAAQAAPQAEALAPSRLAPRPLLASVYGAGEILGSWLPALARHPRRVLALAAALAIAGWALEARTPVQSDITRLVPASMPALRDLDTLERTTGSSGEVDVLVSARNVTSARALAWMRAYENRIDGHSGTTAATLSLPSLLQTAGGTLADVPGYFQRAVLTPDHHHALLAFGIRLMPLARQRQVVERMRAALDPPAGVTAQLAGAPVLAADAEGSLASTSNRLLMLLLSLVLVAAALLAALRRPRRVLVPLAPIVLATGWSALLVYLLRIPLNPMSATLGTLVIAITTEFSVLLSERVCRQRGIGMTRLQAIDDAYRTTGIAVLTSALTAIAGFAVLVVSNVTMLRDFGLLALVDLSVSLIGVMVVLPAMLGLVALEPAGRSPRRGRRAGRADPSAPAEQPLTP